MIDFETWMSQIVTTCELVASDDALPRTWVGGERTITSIIDFAELYEQVFGDLDSEACLAGFAPVMGGGPRSTIEAFLNSIERLGSTIENEADLKMPVRLLAYGGWQELKSVARAVIEQPASHRYRSGRGDIRI